MVETDGLGDRANRMGDDDEAARHVENTRAAREIAVAAVALEGARREHGIEVTDQRHRRKARLAPRAEDQMIGEPLAPDDLIREAGDGEKIVAQALAEGAAALDVL